MAELDVVLGPSMTTRTWKEQFGRVPVQAMAHGAAVIASDSGSLREVVGDAGTGGRQPGSGRDGTRQSIYDSGAGGQHPCVRRSRAPDSGCEVTDASVEPAVGRLACALSRLRFGPSAGPATPAEPRTRGADSSRRGAAPLRRRGQVAEHGDAFHRRGRCGRVPVDVLCRRDQTTHGPPRCRCRPKRARPGIPYGDPADRA